MPSGAARQTTYLFHTQPFSEAANCPLAFFHKSLLKVKGENCVQPRRSPLHGAVFGVIVFPALFNTVQMMIEEELVAQGSESTSWKGDLMRPAK